MTLSDLRITSAPTAEEAAAILAVLDVTRKDDQPPPVSRWKMALRDWGDPSTSVALRAPYARDDN